MIYERAGAAGKRPVALFLPLFFCQPSIAASDR